MFAMMFRTQWQWTRLPLLGFAALAFVFPSLAWQIGRAAGSPGNAAQLLDGFALLGPMLGFLALLGPFVIAALPWTIDHQTQHVYPLALPVSWARWVGMRFAIGALTLVLPAFALYVGAAATVAQFTLPPLLQSYAAALALRFLLAALVAYSGAFALQYLAGRRATQVAVTAMVGVLGLVLIATLLGLGSQVEYAFELLFRAPGPLAIFVEPWTLIDV